MQTFCSRKVPPESLTGRELRGRSCGGCGRPCPAMPSWVALRQKRLITTLRLLPFASVLSRVLGVNVGLQGRGNTSGVFYCEGTAMSIRKCLVGLMGVVVAFIGKSVAWGDSIYTWHIYNGHQYALTQSWGTWVDHEAEAVSVGGHLVTINDEGENAWITQTFDVHAHNYPDGWGALVDIGYYLNSATGKLGVDQRRASHLHEVGYGLGWGYPEPGPHAYIHTKSHPSPGTWNSGAYITEGGHIGDVMPGVDVLAYGVIELSGTSVPEPSSLIAFASLSLTGIGIAAWRRRKK